LWKTINLVTAV